MQTITRRGVTQSKDEFLIQELTGLVLKLSLSLSTMTDIEERKETKDRIKMLESIIGDYYTKD
jgi:hypothetical protein